MFVCSEDLLLMPGDPVPEYHTQEGLWVCLSTAGKYESDQFAYNASAAKNVCEGPALRRVIRLRLVTCLYKLMSCIFCVCQFWDFTFGLYVLMYHLHSFGMFESKIMDQLNTTRRTRRVEINIFSGEFRRSF